MQFIMKNPAFLVRRLRAGRNQKGTLFLEILISIVLIGTVGATFLASIGTGSKALFTTDKLDKAKQLAESQMEYIKTQTFSTSYTAASIPASYSGYTVSIPAPQNITGRTDGKIQNITVIVKFNGSEIYRLENYKVRAY